MNIQPRGAFRKIQINGFKVFRCFGLRGRVENSSFTDSFRGKKKTRTIDSPYTIEPPCLTQSLIILSFRVFS